jgi:hypothetical protein
METINETSALIAGGKVTGTNVYNTKGESVGSISDIMIDKNSGKVAYAVMSFGGFLGMGSDYHPLPWAVLKYDTGLGGYVVNLSKDKLQSAPHYARDADPGWGDREYESKVHNYYGVGPYWGGMM